MGKTQVMDNILTHKVVTLMDILHEHGHEARVAGGAVRDALLGKVPKDIDLATTALPEFVMDVFRDRGYTVIPTGLQHGTVTVMVEGEPFEITTLRIDQNTDGRHAEVQFTNDWRSDAARRDFTFNAMFMDRNGQIHDYFDGVTALKLRQVQFVGNADDRIQEDYLRILRFFRFAARYVPNIHESGMHRNAFEAIQRNADGLRKISGERIWAEMQKIVTAPYGTSAIKAMDRMGVLQVIGLTNGGYEERIDTIRSSNIEASPVAMMAAYFIRVSWNHGPSLLETMRDRYKVSKEEFRFIELAEKYDPVFGDGKDAELRDYMVVLYDMGLKHRYTVAQLALANGHVDFYAALASVTREFPVTGSDLIERGIPKGPEMGKILKLMRKVWVLSGRNKSKEELLDNL